MRFSSVRSPNRSSAEAWKLAATSTLVVLIPVFFSCFFTGSGAAVLAAEVEAAGAAELPGTGVPDRLGSVLMVRSLPWLSMMAAGNCANLASRTLGRRALASANNALTAGEESVDSRHWYWPQGEVPLNGEIVNGVEHTT